LRVQQALKNLICNVLLQVVTAISGLILPRLYLQIYGSALNGMVSSATQFMSYLSLVEAGISAASIVGLYTPLSQKDQTAVNEILSATKQFYTRTGIAYALLVFILAAIYPYLVNGQVDYSVSRWIILILSASNLVDYIFLGKYRVLLTADQKGYIVIITQIIGTLLNTYISVLLMKLKFSILFVKGVGTAIYILRCIAIYMYVRIHYPQLNFKERPNTKALSQRWSVLIHQIASVVLNNTNLIIMTLFLGSKSLIEVSVYTIYQMVATLVNTMLSSFTTALTPGFGEVLSKKDTKILNRAYRDYEFIYFICLFTGYVCMGILYIPFIRIYTDGITDANYIRPMLALLFVIIGLVQNIRSPGITLICAAGHYSATQNRAILEALINLILAIIFVQGRGTVGILIATLIAFTYSMIHVLWYCNRFLLPGTLKRTLRRLVRNLILSTVYCVFILSLFNTRTILTYFQWGIYAVIVGISSLSFLLFFNMFLEKEQAHMLLSRVRSLFRMRR